MLNKLEEKIKNNDIVLKSKYNQNIYYLFNDRIIICKNDENYNTIFLPNEDNMICFYDMYYASDGLRIVIATRNNYDLVGILDEDDLTINITNITK